MTTSVESKPCQATDHGTTCDRDARAKCFHCSRDLCLIHLTEHTQLVENQTRSFLHSYEKVFNDLYSKFESLTISSRILESPFIQLEKWRTDAHQKLDQLAEQKRQEIQTKISEYENIFRKKTNEEKQKIELIKKRLNDLSRQTNVANKEIKSFEEKIDQTKQFLQSIEKHSIKVSAYAFFVNIRTNFFELNSSKSIQPSTPNGISTSKPIRNTRPEVKEMVNNGNKQQFDKKRSLSVCLL